MPVSGKVNSITPNTTGHDVEVELVLDAGTVTLTFPSTNTNAQAAVEDARKTIYRIGVDMAKTFDQPGSLK